MALDTFSIVILLLAVYGAFMATIAAVWSVWVAMKYTRKEKQVESSHRRIRKSLAEFEEATVAMLEIIGKLFNILEQADPAMAGKVNEAIGEMREAMAQLPTDVMVKVRGSMGAEARKRYAAEKAVMDQVDRILTEEAMAEYAKVDDNMVMKMLVPMAAEYGEFREFAVKYAMGRIRATRDGPTAVSGGKARALKHPLD